MVGDKNESMLRIEAAQVALADAKRELRRLVNEEGLAALGLSVGSVIRDTNTGARYSVIGIMDRIDRLRPVAHRIKRNGEIGKAELSEYATWAID